MHGTWILWLLHQFLFGGGVKSLQGPRQGTTVLLFWRDPSTWTPPPTFADETECIKTGYECQQKFNVCLLPFGKLLQQIYAGSFSGWINIAIPLGEAHHISHINGQLSSALPKTASEMSGQLKWATAFTAMSISSTHAAHSLLKASVAEEHLANNGNPDIIRK